MRTAILLLLIFCTSQQGYALSTHAKHMQKAGDVLQIANPLVGVAMAIHNDTGDSYVLHYCLAMAITGLSKDISNKIKYPQARRPNGTTYRGMPSGHTTSAWLPAAHHSSQESINLLPLTMLLYTTSAITGYSRVITEKHTPIQVLWSVVLCEVIVRLDKHMPQWLNADINLPPKGIALTLIAKF